MNTSSENPVSTGTSNGTEAFLCPPATITGSAAGYFLTMDMPGVHKGDLEINLENGELTILGRRSQWPAESTLVYRESASGEYRRVFKLDPAIDAGKIVARLDDGVLGLQLPKGEPSRPRRIDVTA